MKLVIATKNRHKLTEIKAMLADLQLEVAGLDQYPDIPETIEDGLTFKANALKKAREVFSVVKTWTLADDSGLEVEALKGAPGIYSARYAGDGATYQQLCEKLLLELKDVPAGKRGAQFNCTMALIDPNGKEYIEVGICKGVIGHEMRGEHGFGYDPVFVFENEKTLAQMSPGEKNKISHRRNALEKVKKILNQKIN